MKNKYFLIILLGMLIIPLFETYGQKATSNLDKRSWSGEVTIISPGCCPATEHEPRLIIMDLRDFKEGEIKIELLVGDGASKGTFHLWRGEVYGKYKSVRSAKDVGQGQRINLGFHFSEPGLFTLSAVGNWFSKKGSTNRVKYEIIVTGYKRAQPSKKNEIDSDLKIRFVKQDEDNYIAIDKIGYGIPFFVEIEGTNEERDELIIKLEWEQNSRDVIVRRTSKKDKHYLSDMLILEEIQKKP